MHTISRIKDIRSKLDDPVVGRWALERLSMKRRYGAKDVSELESALLDETTVGRILSSGVSDVLFHLFRAGSPEAFRPFVPLLVQRWHRWPAPVVHGAATTLAQLDPEAALNLVRELWEQPPPAIDADRAVAVLGALDLLSPGQGRELAATVVEAIQGRRANDRLLKGVPRAVALCRKHHLDGAAELIAQRLAMHLADHDPGVDLLWLYELTTGGLGFLEYFMTHGDDGPPLNLSRMSDLFDPGFRAETIEVVWARPGPDRVAAARELARSEASGPFEEEISACAGLLDDPSTPASPAVAAFALALVLASRCRTMEPETMPMDRLLDLACVDLRSIPVLECVRRTLLRFPRDGLLEGIGSRLRSAGPTWAAVHLGRVVRDAGLAELAGALVDHLRDDHSPEIAEELTDVLSTMDEPASTALIARWQTLDRTGQVYGLDVIARVGDSRAIDHLVEIHGSCQESRRKAEAWADSATFCPDPRFVGLVEARLGQSYDVDRLFVLAAVLFEIDHPKLADLHARLGEAETWDESGSTDGCEHHHSDDAIHLELECSRCHKADCHEVGSVMLSLDEPFERPFIGDEIRCWSCGVQTEFEITDASWELLLPAVKEAWEKSERGEASSGPLQFVRSHLPDGAPAPHRGALEAHREAVFAHPTDPGSWLGLAEASRTVERFDRASEAYRRALRLDPTLAEAAYGLALILDCQDEPAAAFEVLAAALLHRESWSYHEPWLYSKEEVNRYFADLHNTLAERLDRRDVAPLSLDPDPARPQPQAGRNDPCPCGSGKKYKKCCLA